MDIEKVTSYPGFGTPIQGEKRPDSVCRPGQIALVLLGAALAVGLYLTITFVAHRYLGDSPASRAASVAIGMVATLGVMGGVKVGVDRYRKAHAHEYQSVLPEEHRISEDGAPKLGASVPAQLIVSNKVDDSYQWKLEMVKRAEQSIEWSFNFAGGAEFQEVLGAIEERMGAKPDLKVHLIMSEDLLRPDDREKLESLKRDHPEQFHYLITNRKLVLTCGPWRTEENHVKLLVVDGHTFALGGTGVCPQMTHEKQELGWKPFNGGEATMDPGFRDTDVIGRGCEGNNIADTMRRQFFNLYHKWQLRMGGKELVDYQTVTPDFGASWEEFEEQARQLNVRFAVSGAEHAVNPIDTEIAKTLTQTEGPVLIGNCGNHPSGMITAALAAKIGRGEKVRGIFNGTNNWFGQGSTGRKMWAYQSRQQYRSAWFSEVFEYDNSHPDAEGQLYHKKVGVVGKPGSRQAWVSSQNWSVKSHNYDDEVALFIEDDEVAGQVKAGLEVDIERSNKVGLDPSSFSPASWFRTFMMSLLGSLVF